MKVFVNGKIVNESKAKLPVFDRAFLYGDGLFETMRGYAGAIFKLEAHLKRLYDSAKIIKLKVPLARPELKKVIYRLLRVNRLKNAYIRLAVSRGEGRVGLNATTAKSSNIVIITKKFHPYPAELYERGLSVGVSGVRRNEQSPLSAMKSINYLNNIIARIEAQGKGYDDAILLNSKDEVACGAVSNIFMIKRGVLLTPSVASGVLPGITRGVIFKIAPNAGFKIKERKITTQELLSADEVFFTNTLMEVLPVTRINRKKIGSGCTGHNTEIIHNLVRTETKKIT